MGNKIVVKGYNLGSVVEEGSLRTMYRGEHIKTGKDVFITVISVRPGKALELLQKRAKQSQLLKHPQIVSAWDFGVIAGDFFYYTQEAKISLPLQRILDEISNEDKRVFLLSKYFIKILELVEYIHTAQTTHRDLMTNHLRLDELNVLYLEGFVNARPRVESRNIANMVELPYMAPEQLLGAGADIKTDIYSLGVIFYEFYTGQRPYDSNFAKVEDARNGIAPNLNRVKMDVPDEVAKMVTRALAPRNSRYRSCREWLLDLESFYRKRPMILKMRDFSGAIKNLFTAHH